MSVSFGRCTALLLLALNLAGCQSTDWRLYTEVRDKQGQAAKTAWDAVNFDNTVKTERDNLNKLMQAEIDTAAKVRLTVRDDYLRYLVGSTLQMGLADQLAEKHKALVGTDDIANTVALAVAADGKKLDLSAEVTFFAVNGLGPASCDFATPTLSLQMRKALASSDDLTKGLASTGLGRLDKKCSAEKAPPPEDSFKIGGSLAKYVSGRDKARQDLAKLEAEAKPLQENYDQARDDFNEAAKANAIDAVKNLKDKAQKLADAAAKLTGSSNPLAQSFMANESIQALNDFVKALTTTPTDPGKVPARDSAGTAKAAVALVIIPRLMDEATQAANEQRAMRATPIQMQANYQQLILTAAARDIQSREAEVKLWNQLVTTTLDEAVQLSVAYRRLNLSGPPAGSSQTAALKDWADKSVMDLTSKATPDQKELFYFSAGLYADALTRLDTARDTLRIKVRAAIYERALAYSEVNAKQWTSLIGLSVDQVAASAASGLKSQTITNLLNTLALLGGAYGLNNK